MARVKLDNLNHSYGPNPNPEDYVLKNINIEYLVDSQTKPELKFQISGDLQIDQSTEPVSFLISSESDLNDYPLEENSLVG